MRTTSSLTIALMFALQCAAWNRADAQTVDFGSVQLGSNKDSSVTVTNSYPVPVTVTTVSMYRGVDFAITAGGTTPFVVQPGLSHTITVRFTPTVVGLCTDSVVIVSTLGTVPVPVLGNGIPLPVELQSFTASASEAGVLLAWETASETNNAGFELQRATGVRDPAGARTYEEVAFVPGHGTTSRPHRYSYTDKRTGNSESGVRAYRLRQTDFDGTTRVLRDIICEPAAVPASAPALACVPNPVHDAATLRYTLVQARHIRLTVHDLLGREVARLAEGMEDAGAHAVVFSLGALPSGVYLCRIASGEEVGTVRIGKW